MRHHSPLLRWPPPRSETLRAAAICALALAPWNVPSTSAHSWYPRECCNENDCRRVDIIEHRPDGSLLLHFAGEQVVVPRGFPQQPSQDMSAHVCVYRTISGRWAPRCVFVPAGA